ncbi:TPA: YidH family protein [Citrobacter freundii]
MSWGMEGKAPDYRFTLANERTFLAWIRTALAFMAAAIAIDQLAPDLAPAEFRELLVSVLGITAAILAWYAWRRWSCNERAMRRDAALSYPHLLIWLSGGLSTVVVATLAFLLLP